MIENTHKEKIKKNLEYENQIDAKKSETKKYLSKELNYFQDKTQRWKVSHGRQKGNLKTKFILFDSIVVRKKRLNLSTSYSIFFLEIYINLSD